MIEILTPTRGDIHIRTAADLFAMMLLSLNAGREIGFLPIEGTYLISQREQLLKQAIKDGCTHALWIDADMRFPNNTLERLLAHQVPFVAANYQSRTQKDEQGNPVSVASVGDKRVASAGKTGLEEVETVGLGVALMELEPIAKLERPYFRMPWSKTQSEWIGEDIWMCAYMRAQGIPVLIDHDLSQEVMHLGTKELGVV